MENFNTTKIIGRLLIAGGILLFIPYTILGIIFDYPAILRQDMGIVLIKFYEGGSTLIWVWFTFAIIGLPFLPAYVMLGQKLEKQFSFVRWATTIGVVGLIVQMIGLLRWTFVVPVLANNYVHGNKAVKETSKIVFQVIHQYGGVILGEHLGQLFTIIWTIMMTAAFARLKLFPRWIIWLGYISSGIYLTAQAELFATVMPDFPVWDLAGFIGSTLWLIWLVVIGFLMQKKQLNAINK
ncbi:DUF4386 domain-containing protein [Emticicia sp. BO119]|uniref:DUF4386 domain-containing protein n=1 Tax=Emticicia sp. BO119 TaxID=2757768 RepID=UPI0015F04AA9|nr:DUF4386 domain-containing protein [Emticicia sp. BO119]MBA4850244.1 DUF4386 domain-containing protein [Emticicia sp. BO119]